MNVARGYAQRPRLLRSLQTALQLLETEINYGATPLPDALKMVATAGDSQIAPFFLTVRKFLLAPGGKGLGEAWEKGLKELKYYTVLNTRDLEPLASPGSNFRRFRPGRSGETSSAYPGAAKTGGNKGKGDQQQK
jgi:stage III sporulation protein AB